MWVKLDDQFTEHPKVAAAGPLGLALHVAALCYSGRLLTDGFVPRSVARRLLDFDGIAFHSSAPGAVFGTGNDVEADMVIGALVDLELWEPVQGGYVIHDYLDYNPSREQVLALRETRSEAGRRGGQASAIARAVADADQELEQQPKPISSKAEANGQAKSNPAPAPVPAPVPEPEPEPEDQSQTLAPQAARREGSKGGKKALMDQQLYLMQKLQERSEAWRDLTPGGIVKLNAMYGRPAVLEALRRMHEEKDTEPETGGYPLVAEVARQLNGAVVDEDPFGESFEKAFA